MFTRCFLVPLGNWECVCLSSGEAMWCLWELHPKSAASPFWAAIHYEKCISFNIVKEGRMIFAKQNPFQN